MSGDISANRIFTMLPGLGTPTTRLIYGKREIDIYRNGLRFEKDNVVGVSTR
jgi:hypothetical protein